MISTNYLLDWQFTKGDKVAVIPPVIYKWMDSGGASWRRRRAHPKRVEGNWHCAEGIRK
jgi:hypothetical protein